MKPGRTASVFGPNLSYTVAPTGRVKKYAIRNGESVGLLNGSFHPMYKQFAQHLFVHIVTHIMCTFFMYRRIISTKKNSFSIPIESEDNITASPKGFLNT
jgi:hypothetical protein